RKIMQQVKHGRWIDGGALVFDHLVLSSNNRSHPHGCAATSTGLMERLQNISCFKPQQRHAFYSQRSDHQFSGLAFSNGLIIVIQKLRDEQLGVVMPS